MFFKKEEEREEALRFIKSHQPVGTLIFHILCKFKVKSFIEEPIGNAPLVIPHHFICTIAMFKDQ